LLDKTFVFTCDPKLIKVIIKEKKLKKFNFDFYLRKYLLIKIVPKIQPNTIYLAILLEKGMYF